MTDYDEDLLTAIAEWSKLEREKISLNKKVLEIERKQVQLERDHKQIGNLKGLLKAKKKEKVLKEKRPASPPKTPSPSDALSNLVDMEIGEKSKSPEKGLTQSTEKSATKKRKTSENVQKEGAKGKMTDLQKRAKTKGPGVGASKSEIHLDTTPL